MSQFTTHMGLTAWNDPTDPYSHTQLATNWQLLDDHDHSSGNGVKIPQAGLADNSVGAPQVINNSITGTEIANGSIGLEKLAAGAFAALIPLGVVFPFIRLHPSVTIPAGVGFLFEIPMGQTILQANHALGAFNITLPDLRDRFLLYHDSTSGTTGGSNTKNLQHSHTVNAHTHTVNSHSHTVDAHTHGVSDHAHGISADGQHRHTFVGGYTLHSRRNGLAQDAPDTPNQTAYVSGYNQGETDDNAPMDLEGTHSHGGATGGITAAVGTTAASPNTSAVAPGTGAASDSGTNAALSAAFDIRPAYATAIPLIRVRNP